MKYLIIGNGAAGTTAGAELRKTDPLGEIEIISEENILGYNRPMLTKGILSKVENPNFNIKPESWYKENKISVKLNSTVTEINHKTNTIQLESGEICNYDKLILALGAKSNIPEIPGTDLKGVFSIRTKADIDRISEYLPNVKNVAVIGGGLLGLEAVWEAKKAGKKATIVERSGYLMDRQLDEKASNILKEIVLKAGINIESKKNSAKIIENEGKAAGVAFEDGSQLEAEMIIFASGIKPNVELAKQAGIKTNRFIEVNEKMETNLQGIYACGDCAAFEGKNFGLWSQAMEMGKIAGINAAGGNQNYRTITPSTFFRGMDTMLFSVGDIGKSPERKYLVEEVYDSEKMTYEKCYYINNQQVGGILIGDIKKANLFLKTIRDSEGKHD